MSFDVRAVVKRLGLDVTSVRRHRVHARCPFHDDGKNPNWSIAFDGPNKGLWHCFACSAGGDLAKLVAHVLKLDSREAAEEWLASSALALPPEEAPFEVSIVLRHRTGPRFHLPAGVAFGPLATWPTPIRDYLLGRHVPAWQVKRWGIGYATGGRLRGRVVLVVRDAVAEPASYNARLFTDAKGIRYLTPRDEEHADKDALFGEHLWGRTPRDTVFCSEGGFKSLALERATNGAPVAGIGGSELRPAHARKLATFKRVVWVRDHGEAGEKIAGAVESAVARHCAFECVSLPDERDADALPLGELREALRGITLG